MVAMSRVFLGKHFAGDIAVGAFVGVFAGYLIGIMARMVMMRLTGK